MTDLARGLWCGALGANGEPARAGLSAPRASAPSKCAKAREPRPPAETRRNERRLREKSESIHIKKSVASQQHLAEVSPDMDAGVRLTLVNEVLFVNELFRRREFFFVRRTAVGQFESITERRF